METAKRIDGAVCMIILYEMFRRYRTEFKQMIEKKKGGAGNGVTGQVKA